MKAGRIPNRERPSAEVTAELLADIMLCEDERHNATDLAAQMTTDAREAWAHAVATAVGQGVSVNVIAAELGVSHNAVIGLLKRAVGLTPRASASNN